MPYLEFLPYLSFFSENFWVVLFEVTTVYNFYSQLVDFLNLIKIEDIEFESNWLFHHLGLNQTYPKGYASSTDKYARTRNYLVDIDPKLLKKVLVKLKPDYQLFNYPLPSSLSKMIQP